MWWPLRRLQSVHLYFVPDFRRFLNICTWASEKHSHGGSFHSVSPTPARTSALPLSSTPRLPQHHQITVTHLPQTPNFVISLRAPAQIKSYCSAPFRGSLLHEFVEILGGLHFAVSKVTRNDSAHCVERELNVIMKDWYEHKIHTCDLDAQMVLEFVLLPPDGERVDCAARSGSWKALPRPIIRPGFWVPLFGSRVPAPRPTCLVQF